MGHETYGEMGMTMDDRTQVNIRHFSACTSPHANPANRSNHELMRPDATWEGREPQRPRSTVLWGLEKGASPILHQKSIAKSGAYIRDKIRFAIELP